MKNFYQMTESDLEGYCSSVGVPRSHVSTMFNRAYRDGSLRPWEGSGLPKSLNAAFGDSAIVAPLKIEATYTSKYDFSTKFLLRLGEGGGLVEAVLMPERSRLTLCVSSQYGCAQGCSFCHTGRMGLLKQLSTAEIVSQVVAANRWVAEHPEWVEKTRLPKEQRVTNIVFMGMGEPFDNVKALLGAVEILISPNGLGIAPKRISVSTSGHVEGLREFRKKFPKIPVAFSLHAPTQGNRKRIMPISRRWPLEDVLSEIRKINDEVKNPVLIQYTLISGVNDSQAHANELVRILKGLRVKVNLIPLNEIGVSEFSSPSEESLLAFRDTLHQNQIRVMVRYSKGQDILAACGQLVS